MAEFTARLLGGAFDTPDPTDISLQRICQVMLLFSGDEFETARSHDPQYVNGLFRNLQPELERIAIAHFEYEAEDGRAVPANIEIFLDNFKGGSLEITISVVAVSIYQFFKNYPKLRKGAVMFVNDIQSNGLRLLHIARQTLRQRPTMRM